ncbi:MAG: hypothetical protein HOI23_06560 [Deltaproteobacteria bacterium]|jgi:hypothetical protein|nr:hypothetical protein [Deltaproteobacteria bacterium]MBT6435819.1 hypothetical protein [Deltaproteobacteria bacterium]MBT6491112.1 hypothetical protein [Deltaproteobacteria bacterium]
MQNVKLALGVLMVVGIFGCGSLADAITDAFTAGYSFDTSCVDGQADLDACSTCCTGNDFDTAMMSSEECGCAKWDTTSCADATDSDSCSSCCDGLGDNYGMSMYSSSGDSATCGCVWNGE